MDGPQMSKKNYLYYITVEQDDSWDKESFDKLLQKMAKWCLNNLGKKELRKPNGKESVFYRASNNLYTTNLVYDHRMSRWMNKKHSMANQFWFKNAGDAMAFRMMFAEGVSMKIKMNRNFVDTRKYSENYKMGVLSCLS
jgi:hypothetical protein